MGCRVKGLGFRVQGFGFRVDDLPMSESAKRGWIGRGNAKSAVAQGRPGARCVLCLREGRHIISYMYAYIHRCIHI